MAIILPYLVNFCAHVKPPKVKRNYIFTTSCFFGGRHFAGGCACASGVHWEFLGHPRDFQPINGQHTVFSGPPTAQLVGKYVVLQAFYKNFEDLGIKFYSCICGKIPKYFRHKGKTSEHGETNCFSQI